MFHTNITFKPLSKKDLSLLCAWFQKPHVKQWYARGETYTLDMITEKYLPRINDAESIPNFIIYAEDKPIGYIQLYSLAYSLPDGVIDYKHPLFTDRDPNRMAGIDLFIAHEDYLYKGHAETILSNFINLYVKNKFSMLLVDPIKSNQHAIRFFEKFGFKKFPLQQPNSEHELLTLSIF